MEACNARICICNPHLGSSKWKDFKRCDKKVFKENLLKWNDFKRCNKKVFKGNLCRKCFEDDKRKWALNAPKYHGPRWKRDGIYGQPYDFPYHVLETDKKWVDMIYALHPSIKPKKENELAKVHEQMIDNIKQWIEKYSKNISYEMGHELSQIIHSHT